ncbi:unnamed protein product [Nyctereutes procyonoides]|uniref:(raccoon dog) hypothetical protein n=1 Tax=Nyctereutes procyonoides TaxID=34880 RepID=A0A811YGK3_NYCPR|nr:unnamed protein product [Nyctereutes procyonoides]
MSPTTTTIWVSQEEQVLNFWNFLNAWTLWTTPELMLLRAKESQEGDLLAAAFSKTRLDKEVFSRRSKNFRFKIRIRIFLYLHLPLREKPHVYVKFLCFSMTHYLVSSGCFEMPDCCLLDNCPAHCRPNNLLHELHRPLLPLPRGDGQDGRCLPSSIFRQELRESVSRQERTLMLHTRGSASTESDTYGGQL